MSQLSGLQFLESLTNFETTQDYSYNRELNLERMRALLKTLSHPESSFPAILVGGTKGKGSSSTLIAQLLTEAGYRVGLYRSPHLYDLRERIAIDEQLISRQDLENGLLKIRDAAQDLSADFGRLTYFETLTALAFIHFQSKLVDVAILEVGMGGRLDATTCAQTIGSLLMPISLDHMSHLGGTLAAIAYEKSFVMKKNAFVTLASQPEEAQKVFDSRLEEIKELACHEDRDFSYAIRRSDASGNLFDFYFQDKELLGLELCLPGLFQVQNASNALACALQADQRLKNCMNETTIRRAFQRISLEGRLQIVSSEPLVVLDAAHNEASFSQLLLSLDHIWPDRKKTLLLNIAKDKDLSGIKRVLASYPPQKIIIVSAQSSRLHQADDLAFRLKPLNVTVMRSLSQDLRPTIQGMDEREMLILCGSFYLLGEAQPFLNEIFTPVLVTEKIAELELS